MTGVRDERGYIPAAVARMAASPRLLDGFLRLSKTFEGSTLDPLAREVVVIANRLTDALVDDQLSAFAWWSSRGGSQVILVSLLVLHRTCVLV